MVCFLVTGDKDCRQLITERVRILNIRKYEVFDVRSIERTWGIRPDQVVDFQALVGDPVDNLPGAPLIGPKTASQLLHRYQTLDNLLDHSEEVSGKKRKANLKEARESVLLIRQLMKLIDNAPIEIDWDSSRLREMNQQQIQPLCRELGLDGLARRFAVS